MYWYIPIHIDFLLQWGDRKITPKNFGSHWTSVQSYQILVRCVCSVCASDGFFVENVENVHLYSTFPHNVFCTIAFCIFFWGGRFLPRTPFILVPVPSWDGADRGPPSDPAGLSSGPPAAFGTKGHQVPNSRCWILAIWALILHFAFENIGFPRRVFLFIFDVNISQNTTPIFARFLVDFMPNRPPNRLSHSSHRSSLNGHSDNCWIIPICLGSSWAISFFLARAIARPENGAGDLTGFLGKF